MSLRESLAALEHEQWAHWTRHFLEHAGPETLARWHRQCAMPYGALSEAEKRSDREWADRVLALIEARPPREPGSYDGRRFAGVVNYDDGDLDRNTRFLYRQKGDVVWLTYEGGGIACGTGVARVDAAGALDMRFQHVNTRGEFTTGSCRTRREVLPDGRWRLYECWRCEGGGPAGESVVEELE